MRTSTRVHLPLAEEAAEGLPRLHGRWVEALLAGRIPRERHATCDDCVMLPREGATAGAWFSPATKCCTFHPKLANYLVGAILADPGCAGAHAAVRARLRAGLGTPLGLGPSPMGLLGAAEDFGRNASLRCDFHREDGRCGIHAHREGVCATWFCKRERGALAARFWDQTLRLMKAIETTLAWACVIDLGLTPQQLAELPFHFVTEAKTPPLAVASRSWGAWRGREEELYLACHAHVAGWTWGEVAARGGVLVEAAARAVRAAYDELRDPGAPTRAVARSVETLVLDDETCAVHTYSPFDALEVPTALMREMHRFDGRPVAEVLAGLRAERGLAVSAGLLRMLFDFEVLAAPEP